MERGLRSSAVVLAALLVLVGLAMIVSTLTRGGGPLSLGVLLGGALAAVGAGRLYLARAAPGSRG